MDNALFNFLLRLARRQKPRTTGSSADPSSTEDAPLDPEDPPTVNLRDIPTAEMASSYIITQHEIATEDELFLIGSPLFIVYEKLARKLYRRTVEQSDLSVQVDGRHSSSAYDAMGCWKQAARCSQVAYDAKHRQRYATGTELSTWAAVALGLL